MEGSARQQIVEQSVVELKERVQTVEDQQYRLLTNINGVITELLDKAAKQRGVRGQDILSLHHFFATHLASAIQTLEILVDEKLKSIPQEQLSSTIVQSTSPEFEARITLLESAIANSVVESKPDASQYFQELETKFQQLEENTVQELRKLYQTNFKPGDYATPLHQLQQKVSNLEIQIRSIHSVDSVKLAEATMASAISSFRNEFQEALKQYVSAEDLLTFRSDLLRLEEIVVDAQTRSHILLQKTSHIESYADTILTKFKSSSTKLEETIKADFETIFANINGYYKQWCKKIFDTEVQELIKQTVAQTQKDVSAGLFVFEKEFQKYMKQIASDKLELSGKINEVKQIAVGFGAFQNKLLMDKNITDQRITKLEKMVEMQQEMIVGLLKKQSELEKSIAKRDVVIIDSNSSSNSNSNTNSFVHTSFAVPASISSIFNAKQKGSVYQSLTKCFFTAIFGTPDQQVDKLPSFIPIPGWDAICFTNKDIPPTLGWTIEKVNMPFSNPVISSKYYKWMSHLILADYDVVVWMDGYLAPDRSKSAILEEWITKMYTEKKVIAHRMHPERTCIYTECDAVVKHKRDLPENVDKVRTLLKNMSMPKNQGLFDTNIVIKFHKDSELQGVCKDIFTQLQTTSTRDQLAVTLQYHIHKFRKLIIFPLLEVWHRRGEHVRIPAF